MKLLHRRLFFDVALTCAAAIGLFAFVLMVGNVLKDLLNYVAAGQLAPDTFLRLVGLLLPFVITYALPMGVLTGVLLVLGRMSADREITAIRASGVSVAGISAPILFFALLCVGTGVAINFHYMPRARVAYQRELADALRQNPLSFIVSRTFIRDFRGFVFYVGEKRGESLRDIWVWELDSASRVTRFARAATGRVRYDEPENKLVLTLERAVAEPRDPDDPENFSRMHTTPSWESATFDLPLAKLTGGTTVSTKLKWMTFDELFREWKRLGTPPPGVSENERKLQRMRVQVTIQEKFATAFSVLSFAVIAIPLGIKVSRKETSANLGVALMLTIGYYFCTVVVSWFDGRPEFRPDLLMWVPNLGFQALGAWMFYKVDRQ